MNSRLILRFAACLSLALFAPIIHAGELKTIAILDFELLDDQKEFVPATVEYQRIIVARNQLAEEFARAGLYQVVDLSPAADLITRFKKDYRLHECNGCEIDIAQALKTDRVLVGWVQKVSNLILNLNIRIQDTRTGEVVLVKSVDMRGNTDESWRRSVTYLVRQIVDRGQGNR